MGRLPAIIVQLSNSTTFGSQFFRPPPASLALAKALSLI